MLFRASDNFENLEFNDIQQINCCEILYTETHLTPGASIQSRLTMTYWHISDPGHYCMK